MIKSLAYEKFKRGMPLTPTDLAQLSLEHRVEYVVEYYFFGIPFSTHEVTLKLMQLKAMHGAKAPDVHRVLQEKYEDNAYERHI